MGEESINLPDDRDINNHILVLFDKLDSLKNDNNNPLYMNTRQSVHIEIRTLEFWRSVISECIASFIYVFVICGVIAGMSTGSVLDGSSLSTILLATALASGFAMMSLTQCFGEISGAHVNPAVSIAMGITKKITLFRSFLFVMAQCGGAIAGAAFIYGTTIPGHQNNLSLLFSYSMRESPWEKFGIELVLSFFIVFSYFVSMCNGPRKWLGTSSLTIGATYSACSFVFMPFLNPARSLGPSFILNKWTNHWVYWIGPICGGTIAGLLHEYIFNPKKIKKNKDINNAESCSVRSDEDTYDDLDKPTMTPKFHGSTYNTYRSVNPNNSTYYTGLIPGGGLYSSPPTKIECDESVYGGTKSLYCKSPLLTRANLNRSQSLYAKSNSNVHRELIPKPGPLVPTQSLYPMRLNQQTHLQNQNVQNQLHQKSESLYGVRGNTNSSQPSKRSNYDECSNTTTITTTNKTISRPESVYGMLNNNSQSRRAGQFSQSDDSSYGSYHGPPISLTNGTYHSNINYHLKSSGRNMETR